MSEPKVQLVDPQGNLSLPGISAVGVITATSFDGLSTSGSATNLTGTPDLDVGIVTASSFIGQGSGHAAGLTGTPRLNLGVTTATSFVGDAVGKAAGLTGTPNLNVGLITATSFVGFVTGNVTGNVSGDVTGNVTGNISGDVEGDVVGNISGNVTGLASSIKSGANLGVGVCTAIEYYGDGSGLTGAGSSAYVAQVVTASGAETIINLTYGNVIYLDHNANTTVGFASTSPAEQITIIKTVDVAPSPTLTWPDRVTWDGNTTPTLIGNGQTTAFQIFHLTTLDTGLTYQGWQEMSYDPPGNLFSSGRAYFGALGLNSSTVEESSPTQVGFDANWASVWGGESYGMIATKDDGSLWAWGRGSNYGQLGQNSAVDISSPVQIGATGDWTGATFTGGGTVLSVKSNGTAWAWGTGGYGGTGQGDTVQRSSPTQIGTDTTWSNTGGKIGGTMISMFAIKTNGTLWCWGENEYGELGLNNKTARSSPTQVGTDATWASVTGGALFSTGAVKTNGTLWTWGRNNYNQLGQNNGTEYSSPRQVGTDTTWARVNSGTYHTMMAVKTDGTMWMWGRGSNGVTGHNNTTQYSSPKQVGSATTWDSGHQKFDTTYLSTTALKTDGTAWSWGKNGEGMLGLGDRTDQSSPTQIGGNTNFNTVALFREGLNFTTTNT